MLTVVTALLGSAIAPVAPAESTPDVTADEVANQCRADIAALIAEVETGRRARVTFWRVNDISDTYAGAPAPAPFSLWIRVDGAAADSVMNSPQFMTRLSSDLIETCGPMSLVVFNRDHTGWTEEFAQVDGDVVSLVCVGEDYNWVDPVPWGQRICGL
jgi:hypothetical protein